MHQKLTPPLLEPDRSAPRADLSKGFSLAQQLETSSFVTMKAQIQLGRELQQIQELEGKTGPIQLFGGSGQVGK